MVNYQNPADNVRVPFVPHPHQHLVFTVLNFSHSGGCEVLFFYNFNLHYVVNDAEHIFI